MYIHFKPLLHWLVWAQTRTPYAGNSRETELFGTNTQGLIDLGIAAAIIALVVGVVCLLKNRKRPAINDLAHLFRELCDAHQLGRGHRELLTRFAKVRQIGNPCMLFVDSSLWHTGHLSADPGTRQHAEQQKLEQLKKTIFSAAKAKVIAG